MIKDTHNERPWTHALRSLLGCWMVSAVRMVSRNIRKWGLLVTVLVLALRTYKYANTNMESNLFWAQIARSTMSNPERQFLADRKEAQKNGMSKQVLLFAYMRGGSTILSKAFSENPDAFFWYEPLDAFYSSLLGQGYWTPVQKQLSFRNTTRRSIPEWESNLGEVVRHLFTCDMGSLPVEMVSHHSTYYQSSGKVLLNDLSRRKISRRNSAGCKSRIPSCKSLYVEESLRQRCPEYISYYNQMYNQTWTNLTIPTASKAPNGSIASGFIGHTRCLLSFRNSIGPSLPTFAEYCRKNPIVAGKLLRLTMDSMEQVLKRLPGLYVIYNVRDPRAVAQSRVLTGWVKDTNVVFEAATLCDHMRRDYHIYQRLDKRYPGVIKLTRYEDYVENVTSTLDVIYRHLNETVPPKVTQALSSYMQPKKKQCKKKHCKKGVVREGRTSQVRSNPMKRITAWADKISNDDLVAINKACWDVLHMFGYTYKLNTDSSSNTTGKTGTNGTIVH